VSNSTVQAIIPERYPMKSFCEAMALLDLNQKSTARLNLHGIGVQHATLQAERSDDKGGATKVGTVLSLFICQGRTSVSL